MAEITRITATIANGAQQSGLVNLRTFTLCALVMPAAFTGVAITFQSSTTKTGTFIDVCGSDGAPISVTVAANKHIVVDHTKFIGVEFLKIKSGAAEGAARDVVVIGRDL